MATIAVVEDTLDNMKLFRAVLRKQGHQVAEFSTGLDLVGGLERLGELPDLVLLDIQLPDRDGFEVLTDLRSRWPDGLRVVALTAFAMPAERQQVWLAGFDGLITKPIDIGRFPGQIQAAIAGHRVDE